jgi:hypothetical protein
MKVTRRYNQHRRDLHIDMECEECGTTKTLTDAYDDMFYWTEVVPNIPCPGCQKTSNSIGSAITDVSTKYPEGFQI